MKFVLLFLTLFCAIGAGSGYRAEDERLSLESTTDRFVVELPFCPPFLTDGTRYCACAPVDVNCPTGFPGLDPAFNGFPTPLTNDEKALLAAQSLVGNNPGLVISGATVQDNVVGLNLIDYTQGCHLLGTPGFDFETGVVLSTGDARRLIDYQNGPADPPTSNQGRMNSTDPDIPNSVDCTALEFTITASVSQRITTQYVFLSDEYPEFVDNIFDDQFKFLINNQNDPSNKANLASLASLETVSINTINYKKNPGLFKHCSPFTNFDGNTLNLVANSYDIVAGETYDVKFVICDLKDTLYDSAVVIKSGTFSECTDSPPEIVCPEDIVVCPANDVPMAAAQGGCGPVSVNRTDAFGPGPLPEGMYEIGYVTADGSASCSYNLTVLEVGPTIASVSLSGVIPPNNVVPGENVTLSFFAFDDCCTENNSGVVDWGDGTTATFEFGGEDVLFNFTHSYDGTVSAPVITITAEDCTGKTTVVTEDIDVLCTDLESSIQAVLPPGSTVDIMMMVTGGIVIANQPNCGLSWTYDWGDGTPGFSGDETGNTDLVIVRTDTHLYSDCGNYTVTATLVGAGGLVVATQQSWVLVVGCETATPTPTPEIVCPTPSPVICPTPTPCSCPTAEPTATPTSLPTAAPTATPTAAPTATPTPMPTASATPMPTATPTEAPTAAPTATPTPCDDTDTDTDTDSDDECDTATPSPSPTPSGPCPGVVCEDGFSPDPHNHCVCTKTCSSDTDCILSGTCSGQCLSNGFCEDGAVDDVCPRGCCKATPGNIPGLLKKAICSNGCGRNSCCFENIENGCNSMPSASDMVEVCTALYGADRSCTSDSDCGANGSCIDVRVGRIRTKLCSAQCDSSMPCPSGKSCVQFTQSYSPPLSFCVDDGFTA